MVFGLGYNVVIVNLSKIGEMLHLYSSIKLKDINIKHSVYVFRGLKLTLKTKDDHILQVPGQKLPMSSKCAHQG